MLWKYFLLTSIMYCYLFGETRLIFKNSLVVLSEPIVLVFLPMIGWESLEFSISRTPLYYSSL